MTYFVTGLGVEDMPLKYEKDTLDEASYLALKMSDQGCTDVKVWDAYGKQVSDKTLRWKRMDW